MVFIIFQIFASAFASMDLLAQIFASVDLHHLIFACASASADLHAQIFAYASTPTDLEILASDTSLVYLKHYDANHYSIEIRNKCKIKHGIKVGT